MPKQSLTAVKVALGIREQSSVLLLLLTVIVSQIIGVIIFSSTARALGAVTYSRTLDGTGVGSAQDLDKDSSGNVYVARGNRISKYSSSGVLITTWGSAGTGNGQFATRRLAVDANNFVYILDHQNNRVQKFTSSGSYEGQFGGPGTGNGQFNFNGVSGCGSGGIDFDSAGKIYIGDPGNDRVQIFNPDGSYFSQWNHAGGVACINALGISPGDDLYISDNNTTNVAEVLKFSLSGTHSLSFFPTIAYRAGGLDFDGSGNVFVAAEEQDRFYQYTSAGGFVQWWRNQPNSGSTYDVLLDGSGNFYTLDKNPCCGVVTTYVKKIDTNRTTLATFAYSSEALIERPSATASAADGSVYVASTKNNTIQKYDSAGNFVLTFGRNGTGNGQFNNPTSIAVDSLGNVYVVDYLNYRIQKFTATGTYVTQWGSYGSGDGQFEVPRAIAVGPDDSIYTTEEYGSRVQKFTSAGVFVRKWGSAGSGNGQFNGTRGIAVDKTGRVYVADQGNDRIQKFYPDGTFDTKWGSSGSTPGKFQSVDALAVDGANNVYATDINTGRYNVQKFTSGGTYITQWGSNGSATGQFNFYNSDLGNISGLSVDSNYQVYVADPGNGRVQVFEDASFVPSVTTTAATNLSASGATANLTSSDVSDAATGTYGIEYGTTTSYGQNASATTSVAYKGASSIAPGGWSGLLKHPTYGGVRSRTSGDLYVPAWEYDGSNTSNCFITKFSSAGSYQSEIDGGCLQNSPSGFNQVKGALALDSSETLYVGQDDSQYILSYDSGGAPGSVIDMGANIGASSLAIDRSNSLYVATSGLSATPGVLKYDSAGSAIAGWADTDLGSETWSSSYSGLTIRTDGYGYVYVRHTDASLSTVQRYSPQGAFMNQWSFAVSGNGNSLYIDNQNVIYTYDNGSTTVKFFTSGGTELGSAYDNSPGGGRVNAITAVDTSDGSIEIITGSSSSVEFWEYERKGSAALTGLTCNTLYHYRAKVATGAITVYGDDQTFTTASCAPPMTITTTTLADGLKNSLYSDTIAVADAAGPVTYSLVSGALPDGLSLNTSTGEISGTPTQTGTSTSSFRVMADDGTTSVEQDLGIYVVGFETITIYDNINSTLTMGQSFDHTVVTENGFGVPTFAITAGSLPPGLGMDSTGHITGTPNDDGQYTFTIQATDLSGSDDQAYIVSVFNAANAPTHTPLVSVTSPAANTVLGQDDVVVTGTGPANSILTIWMDNYQVGTTNVNGSGNWSYHVENIFPGTHSFDAKWVAQGSLAIVPTTFTLDSPYQTKLSLIDTATDQIVKNYYLGADFPYSYDMVVSKVANKAYINVSDGISSAIMQLDLASGATNIIAQDLPASIVTPTILSLSEDGQTLYIVSDDELITFDVAAQDLVRRTLPAPLVLGQALFPRGVISADKTTLYTGYTQIGGPTVFNRAIAILDLQTLQVTDLELGAANLKETFTGVDRIGDFVYITYGDGRIVVLDSTTNTVTKTINMQLIDNQPGNDYERVTFSAVDATNKIMYAAVRHGEQDYNDIRAVNLETDQVTTLEQTLNSPNTFDLPAYDSSTASLLMLSANYDSQHVEFNKFNLQTNNYVTGAGYPIIDETPGLITYGFSNKSVHQLTQGLTASTSFSLPLPEVIVDPPDVDPPGEEEPEQPTITDVTPPQPGATTKPTKSSPVASPPSAAVAQNSLFALAKRIPEPFAVGFPWVLLLLALTLVVVQYYQVHSESASTKRMQASVLHQKQLVEEQNNFVALSTHYLHTPLTVMEGEITLMVKAGTLTEAQATKLKATLTSLNAEAEATLAQQEQNDV